MTSEIQEFPTQIVALAGPPLMGKTTLGTELARRSNFKYLDIDEVRPHASGLIGYPSNQRLPGGLETILMFHCYTANHLRAGGLLSEGQPVAIGATYSHENYVSLLRTFAQVMRVPLTILLLDAPEELLEERIARRKEQGSLSVVQTLVVAREIRARFRTIEGDDVHKVNTGLPLGQSIDEIFKVINSRRI